jgi:hypothetical protein
MARSSWPGGISTVVIGAGRAGRDRERDVRPQVPAGQQSCGPADSQSVSGAGRAPCVDGGRGRCGGRMARMVRRPVSEIRRRCASVHRPVIDWDLTRSKQTIATPSPRQRRARSPDSPTKVGLAGTLPSLWAPVRAFDGRQLAKRADGNVAPHLRTMFQIARRSMHILSLEGRHGAAPSVYLRVRRRHAPGGHLARLFMERDAQRPQIDGE